MKMSNWLSRIVVAAILLPIVLGAVYLGGLVPLRARRDRVRDRAARVLAARPRRSRRSHRPGTSAAALALLGAQLDGVGWMLGGVLTTFALAFLLKAISEARAAATAAISSTVMGALWIGGGLGFLILLRHLPTHGRLALYTVLLAVWAGDTLAYLGGPPARPAQDGAGDVTGQDVGGLRVRHRGDGVRRVRRDVQAALPLDPAVDWARRDRRDRRPAR